MIPLANILRAANELVSAGLIKDYELDPLRRAIHNLRRRHLLYCRDRRSNGRKEEGNHLLLRNFPVKFLAASGLTEEAIRNAKPIEYESVPAKVFRPEHII